jgi:hypothetical protein
MTSTEIAVEILPDKPFAMADMIVLAPTFYWMQSLPADTRVMVPDMFVCQQATAIFDAIRRRATIKILTLKLNNLKLPVALLICCKA